MTSPVFTTSTTNISFRLINSQASAQVSQASCNRLGGHLAAYTSFTEQLEVEQVGCSRLRACCWCAYAAE
jgi:hypothetical protein